MLNLTHNHGIRFCDHVSRREALQIGALGTMGLHLPHLLASQASASARPAGGTFGRAKRMILLFMWGGPAHQDTWDLKPEAPAALRGEFLPIETNVPGIQISEHFPLIARHADKLAIIRSVGQEDNNHSTGAHAGLTGRRHMLKAENFGPSESDFPHYGSVLSKLAPARHGLPSFVSLPDVIATTAGAVVPGQGGGMLGRKYDPFQITDHPDEPDFAIRSLSLPQGIALDRMRDRRALLSQIDSVAQVADRSVTATAMGNFYEQALDMVLSPQARAAFDLESESVETRFRYGWHTFGQSVLLARRLIESGVKLVTVYWHREKQGVDSSWDTHGLNFRELKNRLMPSVDRPIAALLEDLQAQGLLDETLIVWNSEFGRTPRINGNAGRDHWGPCNSVVMAGGGVPGGQVFGSSDASAAYPASNKVTQDDISATIYHLLGLDPETLIYDRTERPFPISIGEPIYPLIDGMCTPAPLPPPPVRTSVPQIGRFTRMLIERGGRFLNLDLGNPDGEAGWTLAGWGEPAGEGLNRHRPIGEKPATLRYDGYFGAFLDYEWLAIRLAAPQPADGVTLTISGRPIPLPASLEPSQPKQLWQIPLPPGLMRSLGHYEATLTAPGWQVTDIALTGAPIRDLHLQRV